MGRERQFEEREVIDAAVELFWRCGYESTSLPMLLEATGLSKSSFYLAFESKSGLFLRCLRCYGDEIVSSMQRALADSRSGINFIRGLLQGVGDETSGVDARRGCLVMNTANEFGQHDPAIAAEVATQTGRIEDVFHQALVRAEKEGSWTPQGTRRAVARYLVCTLSGLRTMTKIGASRSAIKDTANVALLALN